jgi:hypothetical protein
MSNWPAGLSSPSEEPVSVVHELAFIAFLNKYCLILSISLVVIACARIISTYDALSLTFDEPFHFACALEYLSAHTITLDTENPPIARAVEVMGSYITGVRPSRLPNPYYEGIAILGHHGDIDHTIFLLRLGTLPFFLLACLVVGYWAYHYLWPTSSCHRRRSL